MFQRSINQIIKAENIHVLEINFQLGNRNIGALGLDSNRNICLIFTHDAEIDIQYTHTFTTQIQKYLRQLHSFLDLFQKDIGVRVFLCSPSKALNILNTSFIPEEITETRKYYRKKINIDEIKQSIKHEEQENVKVDQPVGFVPKFPSRKRNKINVFNCVLDNSRYFLDEVIGPFSIPLRIESKKRIVEDPTVPPLDLVYQDGKKIVAGIITIGDLPRDLFNRQRQIESLGKGIESILNRQYIKLGIVSNNFESELNDMAQKMDVGYSSLT